MGAQKTINVILFAILAVLVLASLGVAFVLVESNERDFFFSFSIGILLFCEVLLVAFLLTHNNVKQQGGQPLFYALANVALLYIIATVASVAICWNIASEAGYIATEIILLSIALVFAGFYGMSMASGKETRDADVANKQQLGLLLVTAEGIESALSSATSQGAADSQKLARQLAEKLRYSDPVSHPNVAMLEAQIADKLTNLEQTATTLNTDNAADFNASVQETLGLVEKRNKMLLILKR